MHETGLVQDLLRQVTDIMQREQGSRVTSIRVRVGEFAGVEPELFRSAYETLAPHALPGAARLELEVVPLRARCTHCDVNFEVHDYRFECPDCQHTEVHVIQGDQLVLENVTLEVDDAGTFF